MNLLLLTFLLASTALTQITPNPSPGDTGFNALQAAEPKLEIHAHVLPNCDGPWVGVSPLYGQNWSVQFQSYHLSRDLGEYERLDLLDALPGGGKIDTSFNGDTVACSFLIETPYGFQNRKGCHSMDQPLGCMKLWLPVDPAGGPH